MFHETQRAVETFSETFVQITGLHCPEGGGYYPPPLWTVRGAQDRWEKHFSQKWEPITLVERKFFQETGCSQQSGAPRTVERGGVIPPPLWTETFRDLESFGRDLDTAIWTSGPRFGHSIFEFSVQKLSLGPGIFRAALSQLCRAFPQKVARMWTELGRGVSFAGPKIVWLLPIFWEDLRYI